MSLTDKDRNLLNKVSQFHVDYADFIEETGRVTDLEATAELALWHRSAAEAVRNLVELEKNLSDTSIEGIK